MASRVGKYYIVGPADRSYRKGDPDFSLHTVISDESGIPGCVLVENPAGQRFPVPAMLVDQICVIPGRIEE